MTLTLLIPSWELSKPPKARIRGKLPPLHSRQKRVWDAIENPADPTRIACLNCGRRWGKSRLLTNWAFKRAAKGQFGFVVAPDYPRSKVIWRRLVWMAKRTPGCVIHKSDREIAFPSSGMIVLKSADDPDSLRSEGLNFLAGDEVAYWQEEAWTEALRATLVDKRGDAMLASTPDGFNWWHNVLYVKGHDPEFPIYQSFHYPSHTNPFLSQDELLGVQSEVSMTTFRQEYLAEFVAQTGRVFPEFSRDMHVRPLQYQPGLQTSVGIDFGLRSFAFQLRQYDKRKDTLYVLADRIYREMTTAQAITSIKADYGQHVAGPIVIGVDPAGSARDMQTKRTDVDLVREAFPQAQVLYSTQSDHRSPEWRAARKRDRLLSADGTVRMYVDVGCSHTLDYLEQSVYPKHKSGQPEKTEPVKDGKVDHMRDADGYGDVALLHLRAARTIQGGLM